MKLPSNISPDQIEAQFDSGYFVYNGKGEAKGYRGVYTDFPENLKFLNYIKSLNPESVLEAGCAYGFLVKRLNDAGIAAEGFDVSSFAYKMRATDKIRTASILDLSCYRDKQFDLVVSIELLEHIPEAYADQALKELARVSRRGVHWIAYKEVDDLFKTKDITHINIKPYQWWEDKLAELCPNHKLIRKETDWYLKPIPIPRGGDKRGLNVGSFTNMFLDTVETTWLNVDNLDLNEYAKNYEYNFMKVDICKVLPFPDNSFDYIIGSHVIEHLSKQDGANFLSECRRVLKPTGLLRLAVPDAELLVRGYSEGKLGYFDEINPDYAAATSQLDKLNVLLWGGHKSIYDRFTLTGALEKAGYKASVQSFNKSSNPDLMKQIFDYHPDLSLYMEAVAVKEPIAMAINGAHPKQLRIAMLSSPFLKTPPDHYGGLEMIVADLAAALAEMGHDVTVFAAKGSKPIGNYKVFETIDPVFNYSTDWSKANWLEKEKEHYESFWDELPKFDIIHGHGWFGFEYLTKTKHPDLKVVHTHHGGYNWESPPPVPHPNLISISRYMKRYTEQYFIKSGIKCEYVYNGINLDAYPFKAAKGDRLLYVGRFTGFKGPDIAVQIAKKLDMGLDLVGGAYEEPYFSQEIKPYCDGEQIILHTESTHDVKVNLMQNARALLFPSKMGEPFGLVALEAMACGTPVVGLNDGAISEVVKHGETGFICNGIEEMIEAVKKIDSIKSESCRKRAEELSRKEMAQNYLNLYRRVLQGDEW